MAEIDDVGFPTLSDILSRLDPGGMMAKVANVLSRKEPLLKVLPWMEGNLATGHQITQTVNALPSATWRQLNTGLTRTKGQTVQYVESCARLEAFSDIDEAQLELNGGAAWRETEDALHTEGISQQFATAFIYESVSSNPERIHGLAPRYPATTGFTSSGYVLAGTNAGVNARSAWLITPEMRKLYGIYPKGTKAGLERVDLGKLPMTDASSNPFMGYRTQYVWRCGVAVEDYRYAVRVQWDPDDAEMAVAEKGLYLLLQDAVSTIFEVTPNTVWLMDRTTTMRLNRQLLSNENRPLEYVANAGRPVGDSTSLGGLRVPTFMGIPILLSDSLVAETAIS